MTVEKGKKRFNLKKTHIFLVGLLAVILFAIFGNKGFIDVYRLGIERDGIKTFNKLIEIENKNLEKEIQLLKTDKRYIEHVAKKELGMIGKNEMLYRMPPPPASAVKEP
ncbi:septum formation initiator family protein [bacterium]|nr:MAG: septum formation initiator family protein [bacterium]